MALCAHYVKRIARSPKWRVLILIYGSREYTNHCAVSQWWNRPLFRINYQLTQYYTAINFPMLQYNAVATDRTRLLVHPNLCRKRKNDESSPMLRVISYNIRNGNAPDGDNAWPQRRARVASLLALYQPDLIGLQEVLPAQLDDLMTQLPDFDWLGVGRDDGHHGGEHTLIGYRRTRLRVGQSNSFWLSPTPDVVGSIGWDACYPRIATWASLLDQETETTFLHLNTHFDHRGGQARLESARLLRRFLAAYPAPLPVIVTGDFNCTPAAPPYQLLTAGQKVDGPPLHDAMTTSTMPHHGPTATTNCSFANPLRDKIDYIFYYPSTGIQVLRHAVLADHWDGIYPSDHLPVLADIVIT
jgi:endonuclease/exonuclease/phosphatase family metal-dependent hydrolase